MRAPAVEVWTLMHKRGCGKIAYFVESFVIPLSGGQVGARAMHTDGTYPNDGELQVCCSCHRPLTPEDFTKESLEPLTTNRSHGAQH